VRLSQTTLDAKAKNTRVSSRTEAAVHWLADEPPISDQRRVLGREL